jgi:hypothetical protein
VSKKKKKKKKEEEEEEEEEEVTIHTTCFNTLELRILLTE